jgi:hypothetical protein
MAMRRPEAPRPTMFGGAYDPLDHVPRGTDAEPEIHTGILHESGGGTRRSDQKVFSADVKPDGTVTLSDARNVNVHVALPTLRELGQGLAGWYTADKGRFGETTDEGVSRYTQVTPGASASTHDPVQPSSDDRTPTVIVPVIAGGFDVNDWLMRGHGNDPYASRKLALLDATRDERAQIGGRHRSEQLKRATQLMLQNLEALWAATPDLAARKQALFELWDECAEAGTPELVEAGAAARRLVIGFIRGRLPAGSAGAFTPDEIARLARTQQSKLRFEPYEPAAP